MAKSTTKKKETRRGAPEAIAKRRAARALNSIFGGGAAVETALDGRTIKRKRRLLKELQEGKRGETLKAHEVLSYATELFGMGETLSSLRKLKPRLPATPALTAETIAAIRDTQANYNFHTNAWKLLGLHVEDIVGGAAAPAEVSASKPARKKTARKKKAA